MSESGLGKSSVLSSALQTGGSPTCWMRFGRRPQHQRCCLKRPRTQHDYFTFIRFDSIIRGLFLCHFLLGPSLDHVRFLHDNSLFVVRWELLFYVVFSGTFRDLNAFTFRRIICLGRYDLILGQWRIKITIMIFAL